MGIDFNLYISKKTYDSWMHLLRGLVHAKERECRRWRHTRTRHRTPRHSHTQPMSAAPIRSYRWRCHSTSHRARSTSPEQPVHPRTYSSSYHVTPLNPVVSPCLAPGLKRSAADAFSPTSSSFHELPPLKRPTGMTLQIPETNYPAAPHSASPVESLQSFAKMSLSSSSPHSVRTAQSNQSHKGDTRPQTLVAAYCAGGPVNVPQVCGFTLIHNNLSHIRGRTFIIIRLLGHQLTMQRKRKGSGAKPDCGAISLSLRLRHLIRPHHTCHRTFSPSLSALTKYMWTCERCLFLTYMMLSGLVSLLVLLRMAKVLCNYLLYGKTQFRRLLSPTQDHLASIFTQLLVSGNHPYILIIGLMADSPTHFCLLHTIIASHRFPFHIELQLT